MHFANFYNCLHEAHKAVRTEPSSPNAQAAAINDLFLFLDGRRNQPFPSLLYTQAIQMLLWFLKHVLPGLEGLNEDVRQEITGDYSTLIVQLNESVAISQNIEKSLYQVIQKLITGVFRCEQELEDALREIARNVPGIEDTPRPVSLLQTFLRRFKSVPGGFNYTQTLKLFERLLRASPQKSGFSCDQQANMSNFWELLEYVLHSYFEGKALLVESSSSQGVVMPVWVSVDGNRSSEHVEFWNQTVDADMQASADTARFLARKYLLEQCDREIPEKVAVQCQFSNPAVGYRDTSASLLIGIKIVGEMLGLESHPATAVTGEVEHFGNVLGVGWIPEKMKAASQHDGIERILVPEVNINEIKGIPQKQKMIIIPVRTFSEALQHYYGEQLQKKLRWQFTRRQVVKGIIGVFTVPPTFWVFKNIFTHPVTNEDLWSVEYAQDLYQKQGNDQKAMNILQSILKKFNHQLSSEALHIQAQALSHLGLIYKQRYRLQDGLAQFRRAYEFCNTIHEREHQVRILIYIADVYYHSVAEDGITKNSKVMLGYLNQANAMLKPVMKTYRQSKCDYYGAVGSLYNELHEHELAKINMEKSLEWFEETETNWSYHLSKQCLGRILVRLGEYDEAFELLESSLHIPILQRPYNQVRAFRGLSDLFLSIGDEQEGLQFAEKAVKLCKECGLQTQQLALQKMLARHNFPATIINSF